MVQRGASRREQLTKEIMTLASAAPAAFNPEQDIYGDGTEAILQSECNDTYSEDDENLTLVNRNTLRSSSDIIFVGKQYAAKKVARKDIRNYSGKLDLSRSISSDNIHNSSRDGYAEDEEKLDRSLSNSVESGSDNDSEEEDALDKIGNDDSDDFVNVQISRTGQKENSSSVASDSNESESDIEPSQENVFGSIGIDTVDKFVDEQISRIEAEDAAAIKSRVFSNSEEQKKAAEALRQRRWWENYLELRIMLQRLLDTVNRLPHPSHMSTFKSVNPDLAVALDRAATSTDNLARGLSVVRKRHMRQTFGSDINPDLNIKKASTESIWDDGLSDYIKCKEWWETCTDRWQRRTQKLTPALQNKFKAVNQGIWSQVSASMADQERSKRKLFALQIDTENAFGRFLSLNTAKSAMDIDTDEPEEHITPRSARWRSDPIDSEVLNDQELYHYLLKEFIENSEDNKNDGKLGIPKLKQRKKRRVERQANKGKKIRYEVHEKLQNFTFPQEYPVPPMDADELFASLFGKSHDF